MTKGSKDYLPIYVKDEPTINAYYSPNDQYFVVHKGFVDNLTEQQQDGILFHEVGHYILGHSAGDIDHTHHHEDGSILHDNTPKEFSADSIAVVHGYGEPLKSALTKAQTHADSLANANLGHEIDEIGNTASDYIQEEMEFPQLRRVPGIGSWLEAKAKGLLSQGAEAIAETVKPEIQRINQEATEYSRRNGQLVGVDECGNQIRFKTHPENDDRFERMDEVRQDVIYKPLDGRRPEEGEGLIIIHPDGTEEKVKSYDKEPVQMGPQPVPESCPSMQEKVEECGDELSVIHKASQERMDAMLADVTVEVNSLKSFEHEVNVPAQEAKMVTLPCAAMQQEAPVAMRA